MATLENVEKLRQRANVSYDEAKEALDACDGDILDAVIWLEKRGRVEAPSRGGSFTTDSGAEKAPPPPQPEYRTQPEGFGQLMKRFFKWVWGVIQKGNKNLFEVHRKGSLVLSIPVTALVILIVFFFWVTLPLLLIALFFGFRYSFRGRELEGTGVNRVMDTVATAAEDIKQSFQTGYKDHKDDRPKQ